MKALGSAPSPIERFPPNPDRKGHFILRPVKVIFWSMLVSTRLGSIASTNLLVTTFGKNSANSSEVMRSLRGSSAVNAPDNYFNFGSQLNRRDEKAVRKTLSGLLKLLYPDGEYTKEAIEEVLAFSIECRRRVKEQLKKLGGLEFWDTTFSYIDKESKKETYVSVNEGGSNGLI